MASFEKEIIKTTSQAYPTHMDLRNLDTSNDKFIISDRFILKERISGGSFGQIYSAYDKAKNQIVAIKLEAETPQACPTLPKEFSILCQLAGHAGFPALYQGGKHEGINYMAMDMLGMNLEKLFHLCSKKFSLKTTLMLADQMLCRIEAMHQQNFIHRDIKPDNFCMGKDLNAKYLYLVDFGLSKQYLKNGKHIEFREEKQLVGTARYASLNTHCGKEQSRRDDLECLGYSLVYFLKGKLPWQGARAETEREMHLLIRQTKQKISSRKLCEGLPAEFVEYFTYLQTLGFTDKPDYNYIRNLFQKLFAEKGYTFDYKYDWLDILQPALLSPKNKKVAGLQRNAVLYPRDLKYELPDHINRPVTKEEIEDCIVPDEDKAIENINNLDNRRSINPFSKYSIKDIDQEGANGRNNNHNNMLYSLQKIQSSWDVDGGNVNRKVKTHANLEVPMRGRVKGSYQTKEGAYKSLKTGSIVIADGESDGYSSSSSSSSETLSMTFGPENHIEKFQDENLVENSITEWKEENLLARWIICSKFSINNKNS